MKPNHHTWRNVSRQVAPRRGAWIETVWNNLGFPDLVVAPRRGAWIETGKPVSFAKKDFVAPRRGAWIETIGMPASEATERGRTPQGCVD